jgi:hypothetical protein
MRLIARVPENLACSRAAVDLRIRGVIELLGHKIVRCSESSLGHFDRPLHAALGRAEDDLAPKDLSK